MDSNHDTYYQRREVSNSDLTALKELLHPGIVFDPAAREKAFRFGSLVDAVVTEPSRVDYYRLTVDDVQYTEDEFRHAREMFSSLRAEARSDRFLAKVLEQAETQKVSVRHGRVFDYGALAFRLDVRCKWDWWLAAHGFGGDLKTTSARTQRQFDEALDLFDWDRSRAWYMDIENSDRDFIYAISKHNGCVFKKFINRGDSTYVQGKEKYEELAFQYWCLNLNLESDES